MALKPNKPDTMGGHFRTPQLNLKELEQSLVELHKNKTPTATAPETIAKIGSSIAHPSPSPAQQQSNELDKIYGPQSDLTQYSPQTRDRLLAALDQSVKSLTSAPAGQASDVNPRFKDLMYAAPANGDYSLDPKSQAMAPQDSFAFDPTDLPNYSERLRTYSEPMAKPEEDMSGPMRAPLDSRMGDYTQSSSEDNKTDARMLGFSGTDNNNDDHKDMQTQEDLRANPRQNAGQMTSRPQYIQNLASSQHSLGSAPVQAMKTARIDDALPPEQPLSDFMRPQSQPQSALIGGAAPVKAAAIPGSGTATALGGLAQQWRTGAAPFKTDYSGYTMGGAADLKPQASSAFQVKDPFALNLPGNVLPPGFASSDKESKKEAYELGRAHQAEQYAKDADNQEKLRDIYNAMSSFGYDAPAKQAAPTTVQTTVHPNYFAQPEKKEEIPSAAGSAYYNPRADENNSDTALLARQLHQILSPFNYAQMAGQAYKQSENQKEHEDVQSSDERKKKDIERHDFDDNELAELMDQLRPYTFKYKDPNAPGASPGLKAGIMAQDAEGHEISKPWVKDSPNGKMVDFSQAIPVTLAALLVERDRNKDQDLRLEELEDLLRKTKKE